MTTGERGFRSSISEGPEDDAMRTEAAQFPAWRAMHGSGQATANGGTAETGVAELLVLAAQAESGQLPAARELSFVVAANGLATARRAS